MGRSFVQTEFGGFGIRKRCRGYERSFAASVQHLMEQKLLCSECIENIERMSHPDNAFVPTTDIDKSLL